MVVWNIVGYFVYVVLVFVGGFVVWFFLFFVMVIDGCYDLVCDVSYYVFLVMVIMWIGVGVVLLFILVVMVCNLL